MRSIKYLSSYLMINCKYIKQVVMKFSVAIVKLGIVFNILWLLQKLWTWSKGMNFVANLWWVWSLIPQFLANTTFLGAMMSKFSSCLFISFFTILWKFTRLFWCYNEEESSWEWWNFWWNLMRQRVDGVLRVWRVWWSKRMVV